MRNKLLAIGAEAIAHQDGTLFRELTVAFDDIISGGQVTGKTLSASSIQKIIFDKLRLKIKLNLDTSNYPNAYVVPPQIDKNHPLVADFWREAIGNKEGITAINLSGKGFIEGTVDRVGAKLGGAFSNFECEVYLTAGLFTSAVKFSAAEISAILLHEVGHIFTYFECLGDQLATNYQLSAITKAFMGTADLPVRISILKAGEKAMDCTIENLEQTSRINNKELLQTVLIDSKVRSQRSEFGSFYYDLRNWESLSDQFAVRHQCHLAQATALEKIYRYSGHESTMGTSRFLLNEVFKVTMTVVGSVLFPLLPIILIFADPFLDTYDRPAERIARIRQDLVSALKDSRVGKERQECILGELKAIDEITARLNDRTTLFEAIWKFMSPTVRGQQRKIQDMKVLEELANNELYVHAAALRSI